MVRASVTPWPSTAASITMLARFRTGPCRASASPTPAASSQVAQVGPVVEMQQRKAEQVGWAVQRACVGGEPRAAHREQLLAAEPRHVQPGPVPVAVPDRQVDVLAREVDVMQRRRHPQLDLGIGLREAAEPVHQPLGREVGRRADREDAGGLPLQQPLGAERDAVEGVANDVEVVAAGLGDDQPLALAIEELEAELGLERLHLVADRALGDAELLRGAGEALVAGGGLEGPERVQRRQPARHRRSPEVMRKSRAG